MEHWKTIPGFENYQVSTLGRVKSLPRKVSHWRGGEKTVNERILRLKPDGFNYLQACLYVNKTQKLMRVNRIVAICFIDNPDDKPQVNHKDGNKQNNVADNLEWVTASENGIHKFRVLNYPPTKSMLGKFGSDHNRSRAVNQYSKKGEFIRSFGGLLEAERETGINHTNISAVASGKVKTAGKYVWKYATN